MEGEGSRASWGFGPCAEKVPYFYGYETGRAAVGNCPDCNPSVSKTVVE